MVTSSRPPARITVVRTPDCHLCHDATEALTRLAAEHPLEITTLEADSPEGRALVAEHRPAMSPLVLLEGRYFSAGRLPRRKLARALGRTTAASARTA